MRLLRWLTIAALLAAAVVCPRLVIVMTRHAGGRSSGADRSVDCYALVPLPLDREAMTFPADIQMSPAWKQFVGLQVARRNAEPLEQFLQWRRRYDNCQELEPIFRAIDEFQLRGGD